MTRRCWGILGAIVSRRCTISERSCDLDNSSNNSVLLALTGPPCVLQVSIVCINRMLLFCFSCSFFARPNFLDELTVARNSFSSFINYRVCSEVLAHSRAPASSVSLREAKCPLVLVTFFLDIHSTDLVAPLILTRLLNHAHSQSNHWIHGKTNRIPGKSAEAYEEKSWQYQVNVHLE